NRMGVFVVMSAGPVVDNRAGSGWRPAGSLIATRARVEHDRSYRRSTVDGVEGCCYTRKPGGSRGTGPPAGARQTATVDADLTSAAATGRHAVAGHGLALHPDARVAAGSAEPCATPCGPRPARPRPGGFRRGGRAYWLRSSDRRSA